MTGRSEVSAWNLPNLLTVVRLLLVPVLGWLLLAHDGHDVATRLGALGVFLLAMVTDRIDGTLARRWDQVTSFGKIADPIADKALLGMALVGLSVLGEVPWWVTVLILAREVSVTAARFVVLRHGVMAAGRGGKLKTALQSLAVSLLLAPLWVLPGETLWSWFGYLVLGAAVVVTVATGVDYFVQARVLHRTSARAARRAAQHGP